VKAGGIWGQSLRLKTAARTVTRLCPLRTRRASGGRAPWLRARVLIEAPPERIWQFLDTSDINLVRKYIPEVSEITPQLSHGDRARMIGSRQRIRIRIGGVLLDFELLITTYEWLKRYGFIFIRGGVDLGEQTTQLTVTESGTLVTMTYERLGRYRVQWLLRNIIWRHYERALTALKLVIEASQ